MASAQQQCRTALIISRMVIWCPLKGSNRWPFGNRHRRTVQHTRYDIGFSSNGCIRRQLALFVLCLLNILPVQADDNDSSSGVGELHGWPGLFNNTCEKYCRYQYQYCCWKVLPLLPVPIPILFWQYFFCTTPQTRSITPTVTLILILPIALTLTFCIYILHSVEFLQIHVLRCGAKTEESPKVVWFPLRTGLWVGQLGQYRCMYVSSLPLCAFWGSVSKCRHMTTVCFALWHTSSYLLNYLLYLRIRWIWKKNHCAPLFYLYYS